MPDGEYPRLLIFGYGPNTPTNTRARWLSLGGEEKEEEKEEEEEEEEEGVGAALGRR